MDTETKRPGNQSITDTFYVQIKMRRLPPTPKETNNKTKTVSAENLQQNLHTQKAWSLPGIVENSENSFCKCSIKDLK